MTMRLRLRLRLRRVGGAPPRRSMFGGWLARMRRIGALLTACSVAFGLAACGSAPGNHVVVRVGRSAITSATLSHWMAVLAPEHAVPDPPGYGECMRREEALTLRSSRAALAAQCARQYRALRLQALNYLISSHWLIGEAAGEGLTPSERRVQQVAAKAQSLSPGEQQGEGDGGSVARNGHDAAFQARARLADASIRQALFNAEPQITPAQVARQYARELARFRIPERRYFEIFEHIPGEAAARKVMAQIAAGRGNVAAVHLHESLVRTRGFDLGGTKLPIVTAIFAASPHMLTGPVPLNGEYALFEVTKITPASIRSLAQVEKSIRSRLARERRRRTLRRFIGQWRRKWTARTACARGYIVQKCGQYSGPRSPEDPLALK
jgi:foldase protein PrsA